MIDNLYKSDIPKISLRNKEAEKPYKNTALGIIADQPWIKHILVKALPSGVSHIIVIGYSDEAMCNFYFDTNVSNIALALDGGYAVSVGNAMLAEIRQAESKLIKEVNRPIIPPKRKRPRTTKAADALPEYHPFGEMSFGDIKLPTIKNDLVLYLLTPKDILLFTGADGDSYEIVLDRDGKWWKYKLRWHSSPPTDTLSINLHQIN